jgi:hypothetical protein
MLSYSRIRREFLRMVCVLAKSWWGWNIRRVVDERQGRCAVEAKEGAEWLGLLVRVHEKLFTRVGSSRRNLLLLYMWERKL